MRPRGVFMLRIGAVFVAICMVLTACSLGAVFYLYVGLPAAEATIIALTALTGLALYNAVTTRLRDREDVGGHIADLSRGTADLARQVGDIGRRLMQVEASLTPGADKTRAAADPLAVELDELGTLVKRLADSVAAHEEALTRGARPAPVPPLYQPAPTRPAMPTTPVQPASVPPTSSAPVVRPVVEILPTDPAKAFDAVELAEPEPEPEHAPVGFFKGMERAEIVALIREAVEASRIDLYLQPIVTLPQRKVRYYEGLTRLRTKDGDILHPADYLAYAEGAGLMPAIDNLCLFRCVQVVRRLQAKSREIGVFCNVAARTLVDPEFFPQLSDFLEANRALGPSLVLEFSQATARAMGPPENKHLEAIADLGFSFSLDRVTDLRIETRDLADRRFRFVKIAAALLLNRLPGSTIDIHPADFSDLLGRAGLDLIAEKIETEATVIDLIDYDVRFGQGFLFSPPRPVRPEVLQGLAERPPARGRPASSAIEPSPLAMDLPGSLAQLARGAVRPA
jgi:cyclic-di-GMP phosphodiesterase TipF (flagellum assembly factor)